MAGSPYVSGPELIERWRLGHMSQEAQNRFLRHLRERHIITFTKPTPKHILYPLADVERLEEAGFVPAEEGQDEKAAKQRKPSARRKKGRGRS